MQMVLLLPKSHSVLQKSITIFISVFILHIHARMDKHADIQKQQGVFLNISEMDTTELAAYPSQ